MAKASGSKKRARKTKESATFKVGYAKPPVETRFRPGESGNLKGRPKKGPLGLKDAFEEVLRERVRLTKNGRETKIPGSLALAKAVYRDALQGGTPQMRFLFQTMEKLQIDFGIASSNSSQGGTVILIPHNGRDAVDWRKQMEKSAGRPGLEDLHEKHKVAVAKQDEEDKATPPAQRKKRL